MGRKPNQLILEFFERGPKLEDASNRYQHTCKSCGEKFPKGRIDSLTNHLVKKCPALPLRDRQRAILQFHELPDLPDTMPAAFNGTAPNGQMVSLPYAPPKHPTSGFGGLEVLAEVSRQHLDLSGQRALRRSSTRDAAIGNVFSPDEFLVSDEKPLDESSLADRTTSDSGDMMNATALPSIHYFNGMHQSTPGSPHLPGLSLPEGVAPTAQMVPSQLQMAASAASELVMPNAGLTMEPELGVPNAGISDKFFHPQGRSPSAWPNVSAIDPLLQEQGAQQVNGQETFVNRAASYPRPIAMNPSSPQTHFTTDFSVSQRTGKPKVRGRFSDSRRKEVQEVRKRGACIRCRMLKKPCSGESPCGTCRNVESARLWKQPCIRTRIAEEFDLYSAGLHAVLSFHAVSQAKGQVQFAPVPGRVEATHFVETSTFATFAMLKGQKPAADELDPALFENGAVPTTSPADLYLLDSDTDDLCGKLEQYMKRLAPVFYESEPSPFMKPTLMQACNMSVNQKDSLVSRALELWTASRILADPSLLFLLFVNPSHAPALAPAVLSPSESDLLSPNNPRAPVDPTAHSDSYKLIVGQLLMAAEKRAASLGKFVMNDLERRLLQRQQANPFETFLVAVLLLACVERMCWLFKTWEADASAPLHATSSSSSSALADAVALELHGHNGNNNNNNGDDSDARPPAEPSAAEKLEALLQPPADPPPLQQQQQRNPGKWPLDKPPAHYSQQGERFSDIVHMLLKMRGVPPKTAARPDDGVLHVPAGGPDDGGGADEAARAWYDAVGVSAGLLAERKEARFDAADWASWELKYAGKILGSAI